MEVIADAATLSDLEVLPTGPADQPTLLRLVDRTRSRSGREQLRRQLTTLAQSATEIQARQKAHQLVGQRAPEFRRLLDLADADAVERYLNTTWQLPYDRPAMVRTAQAFWRPRWLVQYLQEAESGRDRVVRLLQATRQIAEQISGFDSGPLHDSNTNLTGLLEKPECQQLLRLSGRRSTSGIMAFDQLARGDGKAVLLEFLKEIGRIEAMWSFAVSTIEHGWSYPSIGSKLTFAGLFHPFLGRDSVRNDLNLDARTRVCFLTGPNMAGKTTFLKATGLALLLAQAGCGAPATSMEFPVVRTIFSSMNIVDNLTKGESFFLAEVRRIRALASSLLHEGSVVAFLDEPFRGTNVHDANEATFEVIRRLTSHANAVVFIASHLSDVPQVIRDDARIRFLHFAASLSNDEPRFDYRLRDGISNQRLGMTLLRQEKVLELLEG